MAAAVLQNFSRNSWRKFCFLTDRSSPVCQLSRTFGQPAYQTHPHLVKEGEVTPGIGLQEYKTRRSALINTAIKNYSSIKDHIFIFPSSTKVYMTHDIPYNFRQNTEFLYLSGFQEPDSVLVLHTTPKGYNSVLFVPKRDPERELWDGPRSGDAGARILTGVSQAFNIDQLDSYLYSFCKNNPSYMVWYNYAKPVHKRFNDTVICEFLKWGNKKGLETPDAVVQRLRLIKSPAEIELMKKTTEIASQSFIEVMKYSHPGVNEAHLYAKMDFECRVRGAEILAYPPVVAGGNRANTIHYINNNQLIYNDELVLMDAGCEYHGYTSDITRTWPVSGKFTAPQRELYNAVLEVQEKCVAMCRPGSTLVQIYRAMIDMIGEKLVDLGILQRGEYNRMIKALENILGNEEIACDKIYHAMIDMIGEKLVDLGILKNGEDTRMQVEVFCPHSVGHFLGMDVHDTPNIGKNTKFEPGMIITIEPGIYIDAERTDVPEKYRGIGIRIEDNILITESGPYNLTASCPKHPDDIELIVQQK